MYPITEMVSDEIYQYIFERLKKRVRRDHVNLAHLITGHVNQCTCATNTATDSLYLGFNGMRQSIGDG